ncbi:glycosyltransferase [Streptomyces sp. NPDC005408]|uniref:glycosyltransferase n=1 Tax=Streptomyces sp. NPDC005408 TaxID=3155341 RepID=UPI0033B060DC
MTRTRAPLLVAASGPDGVGKSTLVGRMAPMLRERGFAVATTYCYGCILCRRFPGPPRWRSSAPERGRGGRATLGSRLDHAHALLDSTELALRIAVARMRVLALARGRPAAVVTDRGPLDGLAKFNAVPDSPMARRFTRLAGRYDLTLLLEDEPSVLAARDRDNTLVRLGDWQARYRHWARELPSVMSLNAGTTLAALSAEAVRLVLGTERQTAPPATLRNHFPGRTKHIVVSAYDDVRNRDYRGGGSVVVARMAERLAKEYEVTVVTAARHGGTRREGRVNYRYVPVCWAGPRAGQLLFQAALPLLARRIPHDLWMENFTPPFSTSLVPLVTRAPVVGIDQVRSGEAMWRKYHLPFFLVERLGIRCYRNLVVMNEADAVAVRRLSPRASVQVIANGVDAQKIDPERIGGGDCILFLGRIDTTQKGLDLLLAAYAKARPAMPLILAGSGTKAEEKQLDALLAEHGRGVRWMGHVSGVGKHYLLQNSAFVVLPSRNETFGLVALEAMSYGKPVLHFGLPTLRWMRGAGDVSVAPFDVDRLAERMRQLAADAEWRRKLGREAVVTAREFTWQEMTGRYLALARSLLDSSASQGRHLREEASASCPEIN